MITKQLIPKDVISPLESKRGVKTKQFREDQQRYCLYIHAIQKRFECSFFEARDLFFKHRDDQEPIEMEFERVTASVRGILS
jgi:hypothetical protein